ncbi:hypothetical protein D3C78_1334750 [compost metagenome]
MNPIDLVQYGLFGNHLNVFINRGMQIMAFFGCSYFRYSCSHITWINRHTLETVLTTQLILVIHFKTINTNEFFLGICKSRICILRFISLSDRIIPFHIGRRFEFLQITDRLHRHGICIIVTNALLNNFYPGELILPLKKIGNLFFA